ncbi:tyrosine-type recombinase/integrase [Salinisphaera orenii]|uniref:Integrase n=1 Tax=Salinisphaera orenii YIM 95161 TaxID=1051139 RepID=A0A423PM31_9GAMM|nr:site-specific integrase [Salinisphaera halophila]ROO26684.1 integrase [Salinisphaera halophila YIM 95161]
MATITRRVSRDGTVSYQAKVRVQGEKQRSRTFKRKTDAKLWASKTETDLGHGAYVPTTADRRRTLAEVIDAYKSDYLPYKTHNKDATKQTAMLGWWRDNAGHVTLDKLTPQTIASFRADLAKRKNKRGEPISGPTQNRYLAALSAVCKWAWREQGWLQSNPVLSVTKRAENTSAGRCLSDAERRTLLRACRDDHDPNIYTAVMLALATGCRYSNIRYLQWRDVDLDDWTFKLAATKNGDARTVPIVGDAQSAMQAQYDADPTGEGWVFKGQRDNAPATLHTAWQRVREKAGLPDFRFHDLRHSVGSYLTMNGATLAEVAEALGHRTLVMARRYTHLTGEHTRGVLERGVRLGADDE